MTESERKAKRLRDHRYTQKTRPILRQCSAKDWAVLKIAANGRCLCCGARPEVLTKDHVLPIAHGGSGKQNNIQPLCKECNNKKANEMADYRPNNWAVLVRLATRKFYENNRASRKPSKGLTAKFSELSAKFGERTS